MFLVFRGMTVLATQQPHEGEHLLLVIFRVEVDSFSRWTNQLVGKAILEHVEILDAAMLLKLHQHIFSTLPFWRQSLVLCLNQHLFAFAVSVVVLFGVNCGRLACILPQVVWN